MAGKEGCESIGELHRIFQVKQMPGVSQRERLDMLEPLEQQSLTLAEPQIASLPEDGKNRLLNAARLANRLNISASFSNVNGAVSGLLPA